jgi:hypothetical protein
MCTLNKCVLHFEMRIFYKRVSCNFAYPICFDIHLLHIQQIWFCKAIHNTENKILCVFVLFSVKCTPSRKMFQIKHINLNEVYMLRNAPVYWTMGYFTFKNIEFDLRFMKNMCYIGKYEPKWKSLGKVWSSVHIVQFIGIPWESSETELDPWTDVAYTVCVHYMDFFQRTLKLRLHWWATRSPPDLPMKPMNKFHQRSTKNAEYQIIFSIYFKTI